ncbi:MAG: dTDP-glucose 4,6-dehydratase [Deltaproteobacteria bacterium]|nr:dTDP-glucose 4,6-dehydratase [Deltaproteobacteria bacterium]
MRKLQNMLVTGGAGFIGSNFIRYLLKRADFSGLVVNADKLTYAGNPMNLIDIESAFGGKRYFFEKADICDFEKMSSVIEKYNVDTIVHFAAESHVDRSIFGPKTFVDTNINGTFSLLEASRKAWAKRDDVLFHHISTDEVYGSLDGGGCFFETTPYNPRSPYSASKASSDHIANAYYHTYNLPVTISNCSNNYGPYQFPEKFLPLMIINMLEGKELPVYGDGKNVRDWLHVEDHCEAIRLILKNGKTGETYNVGGESEWPNIEFVNVLSGKVAKLPSKNPDSLKKLIKIVPDRPGHDRRYAINCDKIKAALGWQRTYDFNTGLDSTIKWYLNNMEWTNHVRNGDYQKWMNANYKGRT